MIARRCARTSLWSSGRVIRGAALCVACALTGCRDSSMVQERAFAVRDSAGVIIAESTDSAWTRESAWRIESEPFLELGVAEGVGPQLFDGILGATRLSDGTIVVANNGTQELRFFDDKGVHVSTVGGLGEGPREFTYMWGLSKMPGDSVAVYDHYRVRYHIFDAQGNWARAVGMPARWEGRFLQFYGWMGGRGIVRAVYPPNVHLERVPRFVPTPWLLHDLEGNLVDTVALIPMYVEGSGRGDDAVHMRLLPPLARDFDATGVWYTMPPNYEVVHSSDGEIDRIVRRRWIPYLLSSAEKAQASAGAEGPVLIPDSLPALRSFTLDSEGNFWIEEYEDPRSPSSKEWPMSLPPGRSERTVLDSRGRWLGTVQTPDGLRIEEIGGDYVLGVWKDDLEVEYVHVHRLVKSRR